MITYLRGRITRRQPPELSIEVSGVGYRVWATMATFDGLPQEDSSEVMLVVQPILREDAHTLYGFSSEAERERFCKMIQISGIGPKTALAILSSLPGPMLSRHVQQGDIEAMTRVPGVGQKTAQRLLLELKNLLPEAGEEPEVTPTPVHEAELALVQLGWKPPEARRMIASIQTQGLDAESILRQVLQRGGR